MRPKRGKGGPSSRRVVPKHRGATRTIPADRYPWKRQGKIHRHDVSIEEELGASVIRGRRDALRNLSVSVFYSESPRVNRVEKPVGTACKAVAADDRKSLDFLTALLPAINKLLAEERKRQDRVADARIAAIPGAGEDTASATISAEHRNCCRASSRPGTWRIDGTDVRALARSEFCTARFVPLPARRKAALAGLGAP